MSRQLRVQVRVARRVFGTSVALLVAAGCGDASTGVPASTAVRASVSAQFQLLGGYRLSQSYASDGLALVTDADGFVVEAIAGGHAHESRLNLYELRGALGPGANVDVYPLVSPRRSYAVNELFPRWMTGQTVRDVTVQRSGSGYEVAAIGRVFYNTAPRAFTRINVRSLSADGVVLGPTREIEVNLPEQEFTGFIKHTDPSLDLNTIGAGAYDSGQGSVGGLSYAVRRASGTWERLLTPPGFGDLTSQRLPRDADYSCDGGSSWVCIEPQNGRGVWSTERMAGGGVRYGNAVLFIPTLGYGSRNYARQSYTFGDPARDQAVAYFFEHVNNSDSLRFVGYDRWSFALPGEPVLGVALGKQRGSNDQLLFVVKGYAWAPGRFKDAPVLQVFRVVP
jgi:hypothetical protein